LSSGGSLAQNRERRRPRLVVDGELE